MGRRERIAWWLILAALATGALLIGGGPRWSIPVIAAIAAACPLMFLTSSRRFRRPPPVLVLLAIAAAITAAQLLPLPAFLVRLVSPVKWELAADAAAVVGDDSPALMAITLDAPGTIVELTKLLAYVCFAIACLRLTARSAGRAWIARAVVFVGTGVALLAQVHHLLSLKRLYGFYDPDFVTPYLAPLLNPNHLSGLLAITACTALGLALSERGTMRVAWFGSFALAVATNLLVMSRGGTIALAVGIVATISLFVLGKLRPVEPDRDPAVTTGRIAIQSNLSRAVPAIVIGVCALVLVVAFTASGIAAELAGTTTDDLADPGGKVAAWKSAAELLESHRWTGIGRGAFEAVFTRVHPASHHKIYSHVENEYLQATIDWGFLGAAALAVGLIWTLVQVVRRGRNGPIEAGCTGAIAAIALQSVADFGIELPGVALPTIACTTVLAWVRLTSRERKLDRRQQLARAAPIAAAGLLALITATPLARTVREERAVTGTAIARATSAAQVVDLAADAMSDHPADYYIPAAAARRLFTLRDKRAVAFANRALRLHPTHADLHRLAARMLVAAGRPEQACVEWRAAIQYARDPRPLLAEIVAHRKTPDAIVSCLPVEWAVAPENVVAELERLRQPEAALMVARYAIEKHAHRPVLLQQLGRLEREQGNLDAAESAFERAQQQKASAEGALLLADLLIARNRFAEAERIVMATFNAASTEAEKVSLLGWLAEKVSAQGRHGDARELLSRALALAGADRRLRAGVHSRLARVERALGNLHQASWQEAKARELTGQ